MTFGANQRARGGTLAAMPNMGRGGRRAVGFAGLVLAMLGTGCGTTAASTTRPATPPATATASATDAGPPPTPSAASPSPVSVDVLISVAKKVYHTTVNQYGQLELTTCDSPPPPGNRYANCPFTPELMARYVHYSPDGQVRSPNGTGWIFLCVCQGSELSSPPTYTATPGPDGGGTASVAAQGRTLTLTMVSMGNAVLVADISITSGGRTCELDDTLCNT